MASGFSVITDGESGGRLQPQIRQAGVVIGAAAQGPEVLPFGFLDRQIVDASKTASHETVRVEFPVLISIRTIPVAAVIMPLVGKAHGDTVFVEGPQLFDQSII